ncbi:MAG: response regulator transcription factor [Planctomycetota bacterium]|nr:MAG: response regulator transcription factor [Planctomycetota bacterium]
MTYEKELHDCHKSKTGILIVDDHPIVRRGLMQLINQECDLVVCAEAESAEEALAAVKTHRIDLAIVDISLIGTNGLKLTTKIKEQRPHLPVLILTMHDEARYAESAFKAGAGGYVTKQEAAETIITAIRLVLGGQRYLSKTRAEKLPRDTGYKAADCARREFKS